MLAAAAGDGSDHPIDLTSSLDDAAPTPIEPSLCDSFPPFQPPLIAHPAAPLPSNKRPRESSPVADRDSSSSNVRSASRPSSGKRVRFFEARIRVFRRRRVSKTAVLPATSLSAAELKEEQEFDAELRAKRAKRLVTTKRPVTKQNTYKWHARMAKQNKEVAKAARRKKRADAEVSAAKYGTLRPPPISSSSSDEEPVVAPAPRPAAAAKDRLTEVLSDVESEAAVEEEESDEEAIPAAAAAALRWWQRRPPYFQQPLRPPPQIDDDEEEELILPLVEEQSEEAISPLILPAEEVDACSMTPLTGEEQCH